ncbi:MAG: 1-acyl-sn-glycerol-3-phosphate acyltransferase [Chitinophagales bacterium]|jgi:1-acyl-sn-glycerol-3-phosphate acyltransferase|nr:1-acyl-sn-glycerol-3-phosphate acyltransferase [Chitinophagales bacterium]
MNKVFSLILDVLRTIWGLYGYTIIFLVVVLTSIFIFITGSLMGKKSRKINAFVCLHLSSPIICVMTGIWIMKKNRQIILANQPYVIIGNHYSYMDVFIHPTSYPISNVFTYIAKFELSKLPFFGIIAKNLAVLVKRDDNQSRRESYQAMKDVFQEGVGIFLYPEGTRNKTDDTLLPFQSGAFRLAKDLEMPIVINTILGVKKINNTKRSIDLSPGLVYSVFEMVTKEEVMALSYEELKAKCFERMKTRIELYEAGDKSFLSVTS